LSSELFIGSGLQLLYTATASTKAEFVYPLVARGTSLAVFYLPRMLAIHLKVSVDLAWNDLVIFVFIFSVILYAVFIGFLFSLHFLSPLRIP
jgi:hypothetical protein